MPARTTVAGEKSLILGDYKPPFSASQRLYREARSWVLRFWILMHKITPLIGVSTAIEKINSLIEHVAGTGLNTVITGESGVGKEVVAQNLYHRSPRKGMPFIKINCAALPDGLLESELFGFEKGAFTGADHKLRGKFQLANKGVLFLDEIGDMSLRLQAKLLHVLQSGEFSPLGSEKEVTTDAWVIAATNQNLQERVEKKRFREDLFYRLNIINIEMPPLRARPEDIPPLVAHYLKHYVKQFEARPHEAPPTHAMNALIRYAWPGNVRELQNILKRYFVTCDWNQIVEGLGVHAPNLAASALAPSAVPSSGSLIARIFGNGDLDALIESEDFSLKSASKTASDAVEAQIIERVLQKTGWNRSKAVKILKINYRTLLYKIQELGLKPPA